MYGRCVTVLYGTVAEINRVLKRECPDAAQLRPSCRGHWLVYDREGYESDYLCIVGVARPVAGTRDARLTIVAHEALHLVGHALRMAGIAPSEETEEAYAYYLQYIIAQCAKVMP